jgi:replicative DNA helicase
MNDSPYKPSKYLVRKLEDILSGDPQDIAYASRTLLDERIATGKDRRKQHDIILGAEVTQGAIDLALARKYGLRGLSSGFRHIDRMTKGFVPGEVTILSARTSVGKTSLALAIAGNVARAGKPVLFITLEMTQEQLMERYIMSTGGLVDGEPTDAYHDIANLTFMQKHEKVDPDSIEGIVKNAKENDAELVILDHLHYFSRGGATDDTEKISKELSRTAKKYSIPIIAIAHTRKDGPGKPKDSVIDDIRGASFIAQDADIVLMLNRSHEEPDDLRCVIWKNRNSGIDYNYKEVVLSMKNGTLTEGWA